MEQITLKLQLGRLAITFVASLVLYGYSSEAPAWGSEGHTAIGMLAIEQLTPDVRQELERLTGPLDEQAMMEACNWPDQIRETDEWAWTAPRHYINIPRGESVYLQSRDCPDQVCNTEAIKISATQLANRQAGKQERWQAFAWLCHLVGDLHQPLHAGFADDRGGNKFVVIFNGEDTNLHTFWDHELPGLHAEDGQSLFQLLKKSSVSPVTTHWSPAMVDRWTSESHALAEQKIYPASMQIDGVYVQENWKIARQQLGTAASRLALIINSALQDSD